MYLFWNVIVLSLLLLGEFQSLVRTQFDRRDETFFEFPLPPDDILSKPEGTDNAPKRPCHFVLIHIDLGVCWP
jgi:hypothetical protein